MERERIGHNTETSKHRVTLTQIWIMLALKRLGQGSAQEVRHTVDELRQFEVSLFSSDTYRTLQDLSIIGIIERGGFIEEERRRARSNQPYSLTKLGEQVLEGEINKLRIVISAFDDIVKTP